MKDLIFWSLRNKIFSYYAPYIFVIVFSFFSCTQPNDLVVKLSPEEHQDLENLMTYLLFENHGAFVIFGSKPLTEAILHPKLSEKEEEDLFASLSPDLQKRIKRIKAPYDPYECWKLWKKKNYQIHNLIFAERPLVENSSSISVIILNIQNTSGLLQKHYNYFKTLFGKDFDPLTEIYTINDSRSPFWSRVLSDHYAKGLLFGYGENNARAFVKMVQERKPIENFNFSSVEIEPFTASHRKFSIPKFRSLKDEKVLKIYKREAKNIENIYRNENILQTTLKRIKHSTD